MHAGHVVPEPLPCSSARASYPAQMSNLFAVLETDESACKLDIMLVYEVYTERQV